MQINDVVKTITCQNGRKTIMRFCQYNDQGFSTRQIEGIVNFYKDYLEKYPMIEVSHISDFVSCDYSMNGIALNKINIVHHFQFDNEWNNYENNITNGIYNYEGKYISFNHMKVPSFVWNDTEKIKEKYVAHKNQFVSMQEKLKKIKGKVDKNTYEELLKDAKDGCPHDMGNISFDDKYFLDLYFIRSIEDFKSIYRILLHEFGHAIGYQLNIRENLEVKQIYNKYQSVFEDIDEMIAECFMVSEICDDIEFAEIIKKIIKSETKK